MNHREERIDYRNGDEVSYYILESSELQNDIQIIKNKLKENSSVKNTIQHENELLVLFQKDIKYISNSFPCETIDNIILCCLNKQRHPSALSFWIYYCFTMMCL